MLKRFLPIVNNQFVGRSLATARTQILQPTKKNLVVDCPETKVTCLQSGFRVASQATPHSTATVGVYIDAGSRYESEENNGVAHFLEHMAFKGTKKRSQLCLELEVEEIGAHLNAYTSREHTIYYAKCFNHDIERAVEILSDILLHSVYGKQEVEREKSVIIRESDEIDQVMQEVVFDRLHTGAFKDCSLARPILGSINNINAMKRDDLVEYIRKYYKGPRMLLAAAGGVDHDHLVDLTEKYFGGIQRGTDAVLQYEKGTFQEAYDVTVKPDMELVYGCLSVEGTSWTHPLNMAMQVANGLTSQFDRTQGCGLSAPTRLALWSEECQKVESFLSFTTNYKDTGISGIYFVCEADGLPIFLEQVCREWQAFSNGVDEGLLNRAKNSLYNNLVLMLDGTTPVCEDIGRQLLCYGRRMSIPEAKARIDAITVETMKTVFKEFYLNQKIALNVIGPANTCPTFEQIKSWLSQ